MPEPIENKTTPPVTPPTTPATPPVETPPTLPAQTTTQPNMDEISSKLEGTITEKVSKGVLEKIAGALGLTKQEKETLPTDPKELAKFIQDNARKGTEEVLSQREQEEQEAQKEQQEQITQGATRFQTLWKTQYEQLAQAGKVPPITNAADKNDAGNIAKVRILTKLKEMIEENAAKGIDYVPTLKEVFYEHPEVLTTQTIAGARVPVSGGGRSMATNGQPMPYDKLHATNIEDMVKASQSN